MKPIPFNSPRVAVKGHPSGIPRTTLVKVQGKVVTLYSIGFLATLCKKSTRTLRQYEAERVLPKPLITCPSGIRWYMADELTTYSKLILAYSPIAGGRTDLNPSSREHLKRVLSGAAHSLKIRLNNYIHRIEAEFANAEEVANLATMCKLHRKLRKLGHETNTET